jgi:large subunit ribosomal protein L25
VAGKKHLAMPREIQRDHVRGQYLHIDFLEVSRSEKITVEVPIHLVGESAGVKLGGVLEHHLWDLKVECLPQDVPDAIEADISNLQVNDALRVEDITVPDACTVLTAVDETVAAVVPPQAREVAEAAEVVEGEVPAEEAEGATAAETVAEQTEG